MQLSYLKPKFFVLLILASASLAPAQSNYFSYKTIRHDDFSFPIFNRADDSATSLKINRLLQLLELEQLFTLLTKTKYMVFTLI